MPDDTDDNLPDPAQVVAVEPRSAVEAAADPAHGGGAVPSAIIWDQAKASQTIVSGVERLKAAASGALNMVGEFDAFVSNMAGDDNVPAIVLDNIEGSTVQALHGTADAVEGLFARMADLVKRAKAAHG